MRALLVCTILVFCFSTALFGQKYQTSFYGEDKFKKSVKIPNNVLETLKQHEWVARCLTSDNWSEFSQKAFDATYINLNNDKSADLLVKGKDGCLDGNAISFWVFAKRGNKYDLVLFAYTIFVDINIKKSKGFFNITTNRSTGNATLYTTYSFNGKRYIVSRERWKPL